MHEVGYCKDSKGTKHIVLVFPYLRHDLFGLMAKGVRLSPNQIQKVGKGLAEGLTAIHSLSIIHRDLKSANILLDNSGSVVLADFGLAVRVAESFQTGFHVPVCTLMYQAPESLFQVSSGYGYKADVWGLGCILAELLLGQPLFCVAKNYSQLLELILLRYGQAAIDDWPELKETKAFQTFSHRVKVDRDFGSLLRRKAPDAPEGLIDLIEKMLTLNPENRLSARQVLEHPFMDIDNRHMADSLITLEEDCHELTVRRDMNRLRELGKRVA